LEADIKKRKRKSSRREKKEKCTGLSIRPSHPNDDYGEQPFQSFSVAVKSIKN